MASILSLLAPNQSSVYCLSTCGMPEYASIMRRGAPRPRIFQYPISSGRGPAGWWAVAATSSSSPAMPSFFTSMRPVNAGYGGAGKNSLLTLKNVASWASMSTWNVRTSAMSDAVRPASSTRSTTFRKASLICSSGSLSTSPSAVTPTWPAMRTSGPLWTAGEYPSLSNFARPFGGNTGENDIVMCYQRRAQIRLRSASSR
mmetsp:Transcript_5958/g.18744  ORF Transcript_5958/g.18744 Transcript_5958/m.18744 type:complete len:201 (-) Transcript_5958:8-610(-)